MKATSTGLEVEIIKLSKKEVGILKNNPLKGKLFFRNVNSDEKREIPLELRLTPFQKDFVEVIINPSGIYFGEAEKIILCINNEYYNLLGKKGVAKGARFAFGTGRLDLSSETDRYKEEKRFVVVCESSDPDGKLKRENTYEVHPELDMKLIGKFLVETHNYEGRKYPTTYYTYMQRISNLNGKSLKGIKTEISSEFYIYKRHPVNKEIMHKFIEKRTLNIWSDFFSS